MLLAELPSYLRRIGPHKLDIRFWRDGEETEFRVLSGDPSVVERCQLAMKIARMRSATDYVPL